MKYNYCMKCAGNLKKVPVHNTEYYFFECQKCGWAYYRNSKPAVGALIVNDKQEILLTKRAAEPLKDCWDTPGGFLEMGEHPIDGIKRELQEELDIKQAKVGDLVGIIIGEYYFEDGEHDEASLNFYYIVTTKQKVFKPGDDVSDSAWFPLNNLPKNIAFSANRRAIKKLKTMIDKQK